MSVMAVDESGYYVLDTQENKLHGADGGPFPYSKKSVAASVAARKNGRFGKRRYVIVTWILGRRV